MDKHRLLVFGFCSLIFLLSGCAPGEPAQPLPELWPAPAFELVNFDGRTVSSRDLEGKVWVGAFIFTRCPGPCPLISQRMKGVQQQLQPGEAFLVSFTVDPKFDTPAVLSTYSRLWSTNQNNWYFLTSEDPEDLTTLAKGFKIAASNIPSPDPEGIPDIAHGTHIFVVDQEGIVRAFVGSSSPDSTGKVLDVIRQLNQAD